MKKNYIFHVFKLAIMLFAAAYISIPQNVLALDEELQKNINKNILYYQKEDCKVDGGSDTGSTTLTGNDNVSKVYNYLRGKGLSKAQAGGIMANLNAESGINPKRVQGAGVIEADEITVDGKTGYGLAQWTSPNRQQGLKDAAQAAGKKSSDLGVQLDWLWKEFNTGYKAVLNKVKKSNSYEDVMDIVMREFEAPAVNNGAERISAFRNTYDSLPDTGGGSSGGSDSDSGSEASSGGSCVCTAADNNTLARLGKTVAIDAGHGPSKKTTDSQTGLKMVESNNQPEGGQVWDVAQRLKKKLERDGYKVVMVKKTENEDVTFRERANRADNANADIAVSIHGDPGLPNDGQIYPQKVGLYRGEGASKTTFDDEPTAKLSQKYSDIFKEERKKAESSDIVVKDNTFDGRAGMEPGNMQMVQLFSKTPWVYNEAKMPIDKEKYVDGLYNGITESIKSSTNVEDEGNSGDCDNGSASGRDAVGTALNYSWPEYHPADYLEMKPSYKEAVKKAIAAGKYVGGGPHPGVDCGGFVTRVMQDSGTDPDYNKNKGPTKKQKEYMDENKDKYENLGTPSNISALKPGDIAVNDKHTYMYVGPESDHPDFKGNSASASYLSWRTPMASNATDFKNYTWYRFKN